MATWMVSLKTKSQPECFMIISLKSRIITNTAICDWTDSRVISIRAECEQRKHNDMSQWRKRLIMWLDVRHVTVCHGQSLLSLSRSQVFHQWGKQKVVVYLTFPERQYDFLFLLDWKTPSTRSSVFNGFVDCGMVGSAVTVRRSGSWTLQLVMRSLSLCLRGLSAGAPASSHSPKLSKLG